MNILRKHTIMKKLNSDGSVLISDLAKEFKVSTMTVRRDLVELEQEGFVTLEHGGAVLNGSSMFEYNMNTKLGEYQKEKERIAYKCLEYINDGDTIFLDAGTTNSEIAKLLINNRKIKIITNSLLVANILASGNDNKYIMCPGEFRETSMAYMGQFTDEFVANFKIDKLFLGVEGVGLDEGVTVPDIQDGLTKKNLSKIATKVICVADSSKFGKKWFYRILPIENVDVLVTDSNLDEKVVKKYLDRKIKIDVV